MDLARAQIALRWWPRTAGPWRASKCPGGEAPAPNACQIRSIADCVIPISRAIESVDQCVASLGVVSSVPDDYRLDLLVSDRPRLLRTRLGDEPVQPLLGKPSSPFRGHVAMHPEPLGDLSIS